MIQFGIKGHRSASIPSAPAAVSRSVSKTVIPQQMDMVVQPKLVQLINNSNQVKQLTAYQDLANQHTSQNASPIIQMNRVTALGNPDEVIPGIVDAMRPRAQGAADSMLYDFEEVNDEYRYFSATNEAEGPAERFGLMSLKTPPGLKPDQGATVDPNIDNSIWVEGLVADPGSGLGGLLLDKAEQIAVEEKKAAVALAAYEYDKAPPGGDAIGDPYSVAGYYEKKKGYSHTGEAYEEVDEMEESHFYPIYAKTTEKIELENIIKTAEADGIDEHNVEWYEAAKAKLDSLNDMEREDEI